jgi:hypothetical protein
MNKSKRTKTLQIRNSTVDSRAFTKQNSTDGIEVRVQSENVWLTQKTIAALFYCSIDNVFAPKEYLQKTRN